MCAAVAHLMENLSPWKFPFSRRVHIFGRKHAFYIHTSYTYSDTSNIPSRKICHDLSCLAIIICITGKVSFPLRFNDNDFSYFFCWLLAVRQIHVARESDFTRGLVGDKKRYHLAFQPALGTVWVACENVC